MALDIVGTYIRMEFNVSYLLQYCIAFPRRIFVCLVDKAQNEAAWNLVYTFYLLYTL